MATEDLTVIIKLKKSYAEWLSDLAKLEQKSVSRFSKELILEALERREDLALSLLA